MHSELNHVLEQLKRANLKITTGRQAIVDYLITHETHPTAQMIYDDLKQSLDKLSLATVYNTLDELIKLNLVVVIDGQDGAKHYDYFGHPHYHVICTNCGRIEDYDNIDLTHVPNIAANTSGFMINSVQLNVYGLCMACQKLLNLRN